MQDQAFGEDAGSRRETRGANPWHMQGCNYGVVKNDFLLGFWVGETGMFGVVLGRHSDGCYCTGDCHGRMDEVLD